jgi:hypothetical protein
MKELAEDHSLRATGTIVEVDHPARGKYLSVGNPIKLSESPSEVKRSPLLGEHTGEVLGRTRLLLRRDCGAGASGRYGGPEKTGRRVAIPSPKRRGGNVNRAEAW